MRSRSSCSTRRFSPTSQSASSGSACKADGSCSTDGGGARSGASALRCVVAADRTVADEGFADRIGVGEGADAVRSAALVTGASGGLGLEFARLAASDGYDVALVARNGDALRAVAADLESDYGIKTCVIVQDMAADDAVETVVAAADEAGLRIDVLVNNAGFGIAEPFVEGEWESQRSLLRTNMDAVAHLSHVFGARMAAAGAGAVLNVASIAAFMPGPYMGTYYASKAFVQSFTQALHTELRPYGVHVTALCPGPVRTRFFARAGFGKASVFRLVALPANYVARIGWLALRANKTQVSPGLLAKVVVLFSRIAPRSLMRFITTRLQKPTAWRNERGE